MEANLVVFFAVYHLQLFLHLSWYSFTLDFPLLYTYYVYNNYKIQHTKTQHCYHIFLIIIITMWKYSYSSKNITTTRRRAMSGSMTCFC